MKQLIICLGLTIFISSSAFSQIEVDSTGNVGIGIAKPTEKLDVDGKLRVRDVTIDNTQDSIVVLSGDGTVSYRDASTLSATACGFSIGDSTAGGIIFYLDGTGCHGLVAKPSDELGTFPLYQNFPIPPINTWANAKGIYAGAQNTKKIIFKNGVGNSPAADICDNLTYAGYSDWYLPSIDELDMMYVNLHILGLGSFASVEYWSSTEFNDLFGWRQNFADGRTFSSTFTPKELPATVRAVRAF